MTSKDYIIRVLKKAYRKFYNVRFDDPICDLDRQSANDKIYELLIDNKSCMITRFGTTELGTITNYLCIHSKETFFKKILNYITDYTETPWWDIQHLKPMEIWSGVFPISIEMCERFSERYLNDVPEIDLLGSHQYKEKFIPLKSSVIKVHLETMYPFFVENPWTRALIGKKVLVVHPFEKTIIQQYYLRDKLFDNKEILPEFELITLKAVQSIAAEKVPFTDWFEALRYMEDQISAIDFDVCLIGAGAYGLPLAAHVKRLGKKAIHIGGGLQLLFGIKGKRWDDEYRWTYKTPVSLDINYNKLYNEYWTRAAIEETPAKSKQVEGSCYW